MPPQQKQEDPYAEFGGSVATEDPYAEFNSPAQQQAQQAAPPSALSRFGSGIASGAGIVSSEQGANFFRHPIDTLRGMANTQGELGHRAANEFHSGNYLGALTHGAEFMLPGIGPQLAQAGDQLESGDIAGGVGTTLGATGSALLSSKMGQAARSSGIAAPGKLGTIEPPLSPRLKAVATAPVRVAARSAEASLNQKLVPVRSVFNIMTPADEAEAVHVKVPGRDVGLAPKRLPPPEASTPTPAPRARIAPPTPEPDVDLATRRPPAPTETPKIASPEVSTPKRAIDMSETELSQQYKREGIQSKSFEQADELARGRAENKAVMEHPGEESIPSQHSQPKIASPAQPSLTRDASGAPEAVWPKEYKQPTNGGGGNYTADDLSKLKQKHGIASPDEDLTPQLQASVDNVKNTKAKIASIGDQVEQGLGGKAPEPGKPIFQRSIASPTTEGHTAVNSRALESYKYDPDAREFHAQYNSNGGPKRIHIFGDVRPEEVQEFESADSKGQAMAKLKSLHSPHVAEIINGKRVAVKPSGQR